MWKYVFAHLLALIMIVVGGASASAAIFHQGNTEVVVLTESGDTLTGIARDAVHTYGLANNVGRCTSALIQEVHGISVKTYRKNPKRYDRNFRAEQVYVLPDGCISNILKGNATNTPTIQQSAPTPEVFAAATPSPSREEVTTESSAFAPSSASEFPTYYSIQPISTPVLDDEGYRTNQLQNVITCANRVTDMEWVPNLPQVVYDTGTEVMRSLARKVCGDERDVASFHFQSPNAG